GPRGAVLAAIAVINLAVPALPNAALHPACEAHPDLVGRQTRAEQFHHHEAIHHRRADGDRDRLEGVDLDTREQARDHADVTDPALIRPVDRDKQLDVVTLAPGAQLVAEQDFGRVLRAVEHDQSPVVSAVIEDFVNQRARGRHAQPARCDEDILALKVLDRKAATKRTANPDLVTGAHGVVNDARQVARIANAQLEGFARAARRRHDADRRLADARQRYHHELAGPLAEVFPAGQANGVDL